MRCRRDARQLPGGDRRLPLLGTGERSLGQGQDRGQPRPRRRHRGDARRGLRAGGGGAGRADAIGRRAASTRGKQRAEGLAGVTRRCAPAPCRGRGRRAAPLPGPARGGYAPRLAWAGVSRRGALSARGWLRRAAPEPVARGPQRSVSPCGREAESSSAQVEPRGSAPGRGASARLGEEAVSPDREGKRA